jgi:hypothetical protein
MPTPADASAASILRRPGSGRYPERTLDYEGISNSKTLEVSNPETLEISGSGWVPPPRKLKENSIVYQTEIRRSRPSAICTRHFFGRF